MASESLHNNTFSKRKMFFTAEFLHIDESCFYKNEPKEENLEKLRNFSEKCGIKLTILSIEECFGVTQEQAEELLSSTQNRGSCREDMIEMLRNRAVHKFCKENGFDKVAIGDNGLRVYSSYN